MASDSILRCHRWLLSMGDLGNFWVMYLEIAGSSDTRRLAETLVLLILTTSDNNSQARRAPVVESSIQSHDMNKSTSLAGGGGTVEKILVTWNAPDAY